MKGVRPFEGAAGHLVGDDATVGVPSVDLDTTRLEYPL